MATKTKKRKPSRIKTAVQEQVPQTLPAVVEKQTALDIQNPEHIMRFSKELKRFIEEQKLSMQIKGRNYVLEAGWKFAGINFGLTAIPKRPVNESNEKEVKYSCECDLVHLGTGKVVGYGFALCSNKETLKKAFDEYAVASMAQTRAISKAYRNLLSYVMNAAGYETTPAEEAEEIPKYNAGETGAAVEQDVPQEMLDQMLIITDYETFIKWVNDQTDWHSNTKFQAACKKRRTELAPKKEPTFKPAQK